MSNGSTTAGRFGVARVGVSMPPAYCRMFLDARRILGLAEWELAQRLGTDVATIRALEAGHLAALPPWPETSRIVTAYLAGLGLDARPVLHSLGQDLVKLAAVPAGPPAGRELPVAAQTWPGSTHSDHDGSSAVRRASVASASGQSVPTKSMSAQFASPKAAAPKAVAAKTASASNAATRIAPPAWVAKLGRTPKAVNRAVGTAARSAVAAGRRATSRVAAAGRSTTDRDDSGRQGRGRLRRRGLRASIAVAACALVIAAVAQTSVAGSVISAAAVPLPAKLTQALAHVADTIRIQLAPVRDGLRWIEVENPRSRRGDKLQTARR